MSFLCCFNIKKRRNLANQGGNPQQDQRQYAAPQGGNQVQPFKKISLFLEKEPYLPKKGSLSKREKCTLNSFEEKIKGNVRDANLQTPLIPKGSNEKVPSKSTSTPGGSNEDYKSSLQISDAEESLVNNNSVEKSTNKNDNKGKNKSYNNHSDSSEYKTKHF